MRTTQSHPQYAAIAHHIRHAGIGRTVVIADAIAGFIVDAWNALNQPPAPAPILLDRRRETRSDSARIVTRLAHR
jgi:hypothetical protein